MAVSATRSMLVLPSEVTAAGGTLDRASVRILSGGGAIVGRTFDGWIRFDSPATSGTTVVAFNYLVNGQTMTGMHTITYH
jgi:hypothetical protein